LDKIKKLILTLIAPPGKDELLSMEDNSAQFTPSLHQCSVLNKINSYTDKRGRNKDLCDVTENVTTDGFPLAPM
jgi:hypothetical protein